MNYRHSIPAALVGLFYLINVAGLSAAPIEKTATSPNQAISLVFDLTDGTPSYSVSYKQKPAILKSGPGILT